MSGPTAEKAMRFGLPDRWLFCPKMGKIVEDIFVPFKTPLCSLYDDQINPPSLRFHPEDVFSSSILGERKIGLWCDFTKTDRFYYKSEVEKHGCVYKKIKMEGHGSSPSVDEVSEFILTVRTFREKNKNGLVAVHCTHGFNRTGFAIASYIAQELESGIDYAIQTFANQRPCGIYKQEYINDLFERFGFPEDVFQAPEKPNWEEGESQSVDYTVASSSSAVPAPFEQSVNTAGKQFMDGLVKHVYYVTDKTARTQLQGRIQQLCHSQRNGFPGLQPVSLKTDNIKLFTEMKYLVSWKADGMRYMVYIHEGEVYAFDRDNEVFRIDKLDFPHRKHPRPVRDTLVDAEMIIDKHVIDEKEIITPRLLIYDIIHFEDDDVGQCNYEIRRQCIENELIKPRNLAREKGKMREQSMSVRRKDFWDIEVVHKLFEKKFTSNIGHEIDGLIFQPIKLPYITGRCEQVLKWKPPSHNSIDFLLQIRKEKKDGMLPEHWGFLYVQHQNEPFAKMKATRSLLPYDNKIIECTYDMVTKEWKFMRERTDKSLPNAKSTAANVWDSMVNPITKEGLINYIYRYCIKKEHLAVGPPEAKKSRREDNPPTADIY